MFQDPTLRKLQLLYSYASNPKNSVWGNDTSGYWYHRFYNVISSEIAHGDQKKAVEANRLILFALNYSQFPDGAVVARENPDFLITTPNQRIGIEVRDVYVELPNRPSLKGQEFLKDSIVQLAHDIYRDAGGPPVTASFVFHRNTAFRKASAGMAARKLARCVPASLPLSNELLSVHEEDVGSDWLPELISVIGKMPFPYEPVQGRWEASHGGSVYACDAFIQAAIDQKEVKLAEYRNTQCDEYWLLLVVPGFDASGLMCKPQRGTMFKSSFDRVFVLRLPESEVHELDCSG
jgi:hypothetical protein